MGKACEWVTNSHEQPGGTIEDQLSRQEKPDLTPQTLFIMVPEHTQCGNMFI